MVREADHNRDVTFSSIALLQERFRQLQKIKELRQEKQLLRTLSESEGYSPATAIPVERRSTKFSGSEQMLVPPSRPHCQISLSLCLDSQTLHADSHGIKGPSNLTKFFFADSTGQLVSISPPLKFESPQVDIDTSLRL